MSESEFVTSFNLSNLGNWTEEDAERCDYAISQTGKVIAFYSHLMHEARGTPEEIRLGSERSQWARKQRALLDARDKQAIEAAIKSAQEFFSGVPKKKS